MPSEDQHSQVTLPKKKGDRKLGQLLAGSGHRMMVSTRPLDDDSSSLSMELGCNHPPGLSITHISDEAFALSESFVILFVTPIRGGVTDEWGEGSQYIRLA